MARRKSTPLRTALSRMFPAALLRRLAVDTGAMRRRRRVDPVKLFWVLILTLAGGRSRTIADLRRSYERVTGMRLSASSFYNRLTPAFARFLKEILAVSLENLQRRNEGSKAVLGQIHEVLCVDSTVIRLHDTLARHWPACRTNHTLAAAKLHTVINARGRGPQSIKVTSERVHDGPVLRAGRWVQGRLLLFDLGYFRYSLFAAIHAHGGFFLTRLKDNANPTLLRLHRRHRGRAIPVTGLGLRDLRPRLLRRVLDAEAEISFQQRRYAGKRKSATMSLRVVGLWDEARQLHHWYITNLPVDTVKPEDIGQLYAARWTIELLFRELKTCYQLESMPSRKSHIVEALLYAAFLTLLASRALLMAIRHWGNLPEERRTPAERWARLLVSAAPDLLALVLDPPAMARTRERPLLQFFLSEAPDPNSKRKLLPERTRLKIAA